jgi:cell division protein FtsI/penicillin-binding protein 2
VTPEREVVRRVDIPAAMLAHVREGMRRVVASDRGTGTAARVPGVQVAGKTGSAQRKPSDEKTHAWFTCFAPFESPKYVCTIFVALSGYGGEISAPIAGAVMAKLFSNASTDDQGPEGALVAEAQSGAQSAPANST